MRDKIAASLNRRFGMRYTMDDIFMTSGAAGALAHAFRLVTKPGDEILTFAPFFPEYRPYTAGAGLTLRVVPANTENFQINFDAFERMLTPAVQAVLINTPNNPSGAVYSAETLRQMAGAAAAKGKGVWPRHLADFRRAVSRNRLRRQAGSLCVAVLSAHDFLLFLLQEPVRFRASASAMSP